MGERGPVEERTSKPGARPAGALAAALAVAAVLSSWNPFAAPLGVIVGLAVSVVSLVALRRRAARRGMAVFTLVVGLVAVAIGSAVLVSTAGTVGADLPGKPVVKARSAAELQTLLDEAAERTRLERERARQDLERVTGGRGSSGSDSRARGDTGQPSGSAGR